MALAEQKSLILDQVLKALGLGVNVLDGFIDGVLANVLAWELKAISSQSLEGKSVMHKVEVLKSPLLVVFDELVVEVSLWQVIGRVHVVLYKVTMI